jgi:hypothetical protein
MRDLLTAQVADHDLIKGYATDQDAHRHYFPRRRIDRLTGPSDINTGLKSWGIPPDPSELTLSAEQSAKIFKSVGAGFERLGTRAIAANHLSQAFAPTPASNPNAGNRNGWF